MRSLNIGTSGWSYAHWDTVFYRGIPSSHWLEFFAKHFATVEVNSTFYRLPTEKTVKNWDKNTPDDFVFSVKASRYITHVKRLKEFDSVQTFLKNLQPIQHKLGPILFLLPANFQLNYSRLAEFIKYLPKNYRYTFEFRHPSWLIEEVYALLKKNDIALCISDLNGKLTPIQVTASFVYVRLHGPKEAYRGRYSLSQLKQWEKRIKEWRSKKLSVYIYFDNDEKGFAIKDAKILNKLLESNKIKRSVSMPQYGKKSQASVKSAVKKQKAGTLKSGRSGQKVTSRKQAIAIGLSEARKKGVKVPPRQR